MKNDGKTVPAVSIGCHAGSRCCLNAELEGRFDLTLFSSTSLSFILENCLFCLFPNFRFLCSFFFLICWPSKLEWSLFPRLGNVPLEPKHLNTLRIRVLSGFFGYLIFDSLFFIFSIDSMFMFSHFFHTSVQNVQILFNFIYRRHICRSICVATHIRAKCAFIILTTNIEIGNSFYELSIFFDGLERMTNNIHMTDRNQHEVGYRLWHLFQCYCFFAFFQ